jgi:hypothetical protein
MELEERGVRFLTTGIADIAGLLTTWFVDPWDVVFILIEKKEPLLPYWSQIPSGGNELNDLRFEVAADTSFSALPTQG